MSYSRKDTSTYVTARYVHTYDCDQFTCAILGLLVDNEIDLSIRYGKVRVFINKTLSTETTYQQRPLLNQVDSW